MSATLLACVCALISIAFFVSAGMLNKKSWDARGRQRRYDLEHGCVADLNATTASEWCIVSTEYTTPSRCAHITPGLCFPLATYGGGAAVSRRFVFVNGSGVVVLGGPADGPQMDTRDAAAFATLQMQAAVLGGVGGFILLTGLCIKTRDENDQSRPLPTGGGVYWNPMDSRWEGAIPTPTGL